MQACSSEGGRKGAKSNGSVLLRKTVSFGSEAKLSRTKTQRWSLLRSIIVPQASKALHPAWQQERNTILVRAIFSEVRRLRLVQAAAAPTSSLRARAHAALSILRLAVRNVLIARAAVLALQQHLEERREERQRALALAEQLAKEQKLCDMEKSLRVAKNFETLKSDLANAVRIAEKDDLESQKRLLSVLQSTAVNIQLMGGSFSDMAARLKELQAMMNSLSSSIAAATSAAKGKITPDLGSAAPAPEESLTTQQVEIPEATPKGSRSELKAASSELCLACASELMSTVAIAEQGRCSDSESSEGEIEETGDMLEQEEQVVEEEQEEEKEEEEQEPSQRSGQASPFEPEEERRTSQNEEDLDAADFPLPSVSEVASRSGSQAPGDRVSRQMVLQRLARLGSWRRLSYSRTKSLGPSKELDAGLQEGPPLEEQAPVSCAWGAPRATTLGNSPPEDAGLSRLGSFSMQVSFPGKRTLYEEAGTLPDISEPEDNLCSEVPKVAAEKPAKDVVKKRPWEHSWFAKPHLRPPEEHTEEDSSAAGLSPRARLVLPLELRSPREKDFPSREELSDFKRFSSRATTGIESSRSYAANDVCTKARKEVLSARSKAHEAFQAVPEQLPSRAISGGCKALHKKSYFLPAMSQAAGMRRSRLAPEAL